MKRYYVSFLVIIILLPLMSPLLHAVAQQHTSDNHLFIKGTTIYVDDDNTLGPWDGTYEHPYQYIYDGILHATNGDTVYVFNGLYNETLIINKTIVLRGQQQEHTIINGNNNGSIIQITTHGVHIQGFTIINSGGNQMNAGIIINATATTISHCTIYRTRTGIFTSSNDTVIANCRFHTNGFGIVTRLCRTISITHCLFYHNGIGVYMNKSHDISISNSYADTNGIGFFASQSTHITIIDSAARDNNDNEGGMFFSHCIDIHITNSYLCHNGFGVNLLNVTSCFIDHCIFSLNTHFALKLRDVITPIVITNCIFTKNLRYGIYAEHSVFTVSWSNFIQNSLFGLYSVSSVIDARYNWWGFCSGPAYSGIGFADRATMDKRNIRYKPSLTFCMPDVGADWSLENTYQKPQYDTPSQQRITFPEQDTDGDGAPDWWEIKWGYDPLIWDDHYHLDPDADALNNIEECYMDAYGANPFKKDIFLELDWTKALDENRTNEPPQKEIQQMKDAFAAYNISLHIDTGNLGGGEEIPSRLFVSYADLIDLYWDYFLHQNLNNPRQHIFHYGLHCDYTEGPGFAVIGWNHLNFFVIGTQNLAENHPSFRPERLTMTSTMHELGHTLGLIATVHPGIDNRAAMKPRYKEFWMYRNYKSVLNYLYTFTLMDFSDGSHGRGDYDDWGNLDFMFFKNTNFSYPAP